MDYGDLPSWIEAVATVLAALGAGVAVFYAHRAYRLELKRDTDRDDERRQERRERERLRRQDEQDRLERESRAQAEQVSAWLENRPDARSVVRCRNASILPIYEVKSRVYPPHVGDDEAVTLDEWAVIPPGATLEVDTESLHLADDHFCAIAFIDSNNRAWVRNKYGKLEPDVEW